jgi:PAS domain S-box-containing protein
MIGTLNEVLIESLLETLPLEFSVIDKNDKVLAWNRHGTRFFKRPVAVIGRDVRDCHPKKSLHLVEKLLEEMKSGERDKARFWIDLNINDSGSPRKVMIEYYALRDIEGTYLGCVEATQDITDIQKLEGQKRLLD